jgi:amino acid permease
MLNFEGNPTCLNIRASMKKPEQFHLAFFISAIFVCLFTIIVGVLGYSTFGDESEGIILLNFPDGALEFSVRLTYCICLLGSYPIQMFAAIDIIESYSWYERLPNIESIDLRYYAIRTLYVVITALVAIIVPKFGLFLNFIGSLAGTAL